MKKFTKKILAVVLVLSSLVGFGASVTSFASENGYGLLAKLGLTNRAPRQQSMNEDAEADYEVFYNDYGDMEVVVDGVKYTCSYNNGELTIENIDRIDESKIIDELEIPQFINGIQVTCISAESNIPAVKILKLPEGLKRFLYVHINYSFIYLPNTLEDINGLSILLFMGCDHIVIPKDAESVRNLFSDATDFITEKICTPDEAEDMLEEMERSSFGWCPCSSLFSF